jgi:hypothetical protein
MATDAAVNALADASLQSANVVETIVPSSKKGESPNIVDLFNFSPARIV